MPFIFKPSETKIESMDDWEKIDSKDLVIYRLHFEKRHLKLRAYQKLDYTADFDEIELDIQSFKNLILNAQIGHYLVAHYICDSAHRLSLAFCIKSKKSGSQTEDPIASRIFTHKGIPIDLDDLNYGIGSYLKRKQAILREGNQEFEKDALGRAHQINQPLKDCIKQVNSNMYLYFIYDKLGLSVAFSEDAIDFDQSISIKPEIPVYDHGSACCPI